MVNKRNWRREPKNVFFRRSLSPLFLFGSFHCIVNFWGFNAQTDSIFIWLPNSLAKYAWSGRWRSERENETGQMYAPMKRKRCIHTYTIEFKDPTKTISNSFRARVHVSGVWACVFVTSEWSSTEQVQQKKILLNFLANNKITLKLVRGLSCECI